MRAEPQKYSPFLTTKQSALEKVKHGGNSVVKVFVAESNPDFNFIIVERLTPRFDLSDFVSRNEKIKFATDESPSYTENPEQKILAREENSAYVLTKLEKFVADLSKFSQIGDYSNSQVIWNGSRFVLLDWAGSTEFANRINDQNIVIDHLDGRSSIGKKYLNHLKQIVRHKRLDPLMNCSNLFSD